MAIVAAVQFSTVSSLEDNLTQVEKDIQRAAEEGAKCVVFPEEFLTLQWLPEDKLKFAEPLFHGPIQDRLSHFAKTYGIWLIAGTLPIQSEESHRYYSSCLVWDNLGNPVDYYNKIHLFDVEIGGGESYCESNIVKPGRKLTVLPTPFGKVGLAICYDLRFPELFRYFYKNQVDIIVIPSAFTQQTGKVHWETLLRARAIENLAYVVAPNQVGTRLSGHGTYGHSLIIGPWGDILKSLTDQTGLIVADLDRDKMDAIRHKFPALKHTQDFIFQALAHSE